MRKFFFFCHFFLTVTITALSQQEKPMIWRIGTPDYSGFEFALAPDGFRKFVAHDFGYEDKYFLIGYSDEKQEFPYVLPGPVDTWGGTWSTAGWRINQVNILFGAEEIATNGDYKLVVALSDYAKAFLPLIKISINNQVVKEQLAAVGYNIKAQKHPSYTEPVKDSASLTGDLTKATPITIEIPIQKNILKKGGNSIIIEVLEGSWILFDYIQLNGSPIKLENPEKAFVRNVKPAGYELLHNGREIQPLLVNVEHLSGLPKISVELDGNQVFQEIAEKGNYEFEVPMQAVEKKKQSRYTIFADGEVIAAGTIERSKQKKQTLADYVDTRIGSGHSRWMIAPGPWMPFGMVKLSPDNQNSGWQAGYQPSFESIGTFSHIHEWTLAGLGIFATNGKLITQIGDERQPGSGYRSEIDKTTEEAPIGYYKVLLKDYGIKAELTASTRCGMMQFTFPPDRDSSRVLLDLHIPSENDYLLKNIYLRKINDYRIEGFSHQLSPRVWGDINQDYTVHFVLEFDQPIQSSGGWVNDDVFQGEIMRAENIKDAGFFLQFNAKVHPVVTMRSAISLVSIENASLNLKTEISQPFGWDFQAVRQHQLNQWNDIFSRVKITTSNRQEKIRFYNAMYRSICSRTIWSDMNGQWRGTDGKIQQMNNPDNFALGCDAFWNTFWNLNQFWNLITPEWSNRWVNSQLAMYEAYGWLAKGPGGMNYIPVMVAEHEIPMMVAAYQMGIRNYDTAKLLEAVVKMQTTPAQKVFNGFAGNRNLVPYLKYQYVPSDKGRFSNTMEYSYDDWTVGQLARAMGRDDLYKTFNDRGSWWKNAMDKDGYCHMKLSNGEWVPQFDPFRTGANRHYVEGNAWQLSFFVPQDVPALVDIIGRKKFIDRLEWGFNASEPWRYNGMNDQYWDYPVVQGNQQSMHFPFLFNWAGKPWATQKWSRSVMERYYGYGIGNAYLGDEDQGQMSGWFVMAAMGLFQTDGGCSINPEYEIASPLFEKIEIDLGERYGRGKKFVIEAKGASRRNRYIQNAMLNGKALNSFKFPVSELLKGGTLNLEMGSAPNEAWGLEK